MTELRTSEVLHRAADLIEKRGWTQGSGGWGDSPGSSTLCIEGGIAAAVGVTNPAGFARNAFRDCPAYRAVADYLAPQVSASPFVAKAFHKDGIYVWNDDADRTASEVVEVLRAAAAIEAAKEDAGAADMFAFMASPVEVSA